MTNIIGDKSVENILVYKIDANYLESKGDFLCEVCDDWLNENHLNAFCYTFVMFEEKGDFIVDYQNDIKNKETIKSKIEEFLKRFNIQFELE